ncbi:putative UDP-rhamnose:rhamnosyltransferase 1 [Panicum miliaceum]|uniref:UDP-rhamnose:rhamnosyltransferase 1 n=1 Tax=Panicum miliaceum TaxID=4540 RepID=A0A3L6QNL2_PANMI|nr:putative UDP-rhamnose:rhamnosyltransferase 1 [Panicum miliaceum]
MAETTQAPPLHVVVLPWHAFGHIVPFLELAEQLARRGHFVTFVSAPRNIARLRPVPGLELSSRIRLVALPLPAVDGLPAGAESTADVPPEKVELLKVAFDGLAGPVASFLAEASAGGGAGGEGHGRRPDWIILDFAHNWLPPVAEQHEVPCALFLIFPAPFVAFVGPKAANDAHPRTAEEDFTVPPPWIPSPSSTLAFHLHEARPIARRFRQPNASGTSDMDRFWETEQRCRLLVCRSSREVDGPAICDLLPDLYGKPVLPSGLLAPYDAAAVAAHHGAGAGDDDEVVMRWLDAQPARSVLYVAFGSEAPLTPELVREVALGLELAGVRFLWALREAAGGGGAGLLPAGFERRVAGRGALRVGWAPQVRVLAHAAVGAFMTHAGWSSLVEGLLFSHPFVMLPLFGDQGLTARLMAARGVGLEVPRGDGDGSVAREDVAAAVRRVLVEEEGEAFARVVKELQRLLWDRERQEGYVDELVGTLLQWRHGE